MQLETESISYGLEKSFASILFHGPSVICPYHRHPEFEIVAIDSGSGRLVAGDYFGTFQSGEVFFLGEDLPHIFQSSKTGPAEVRTHVIQFRRDFAGDRLFELPEMRQVSRLLVRASRGLRIVGVTRKRVRQMMWEVHKAAGGERLTRLLELLLLLAGKRPFKPLAQPTYNAALVPADGRMPLVMAYIQENLLQTISIREVAKRVGLTPNAFCRYFKRQTRRTFTDVINELRVGEACRSLTESTKSVTEICFACGFGNLAHFHAEFRKRMDLSPLQYRKVRTS